MHVNPRFLGLHNDCRSQTVLLAVAGYTVAGARFDALVYGSNIVTMAGEV
jgi:hypothetical protein